MRQGYRCRHDSRVASVLAKPLHYRVVDLDDVDQKALEVGKRRVAGAEVVYGEFHAQVLQCVQCSHSGRSVFHGCALSDLQDQATRVKPSLVESARDLPDEMTVVDLGSGDVDANCQAQVIGVALLPPLALTASLPKDPPPDAHDQAGLLGERDEL